MSLVAKRPTARHKTLQTKREKRAVFTCAALSYGSANILELATIATETPQIRSAL
jgi:hypothetical protein